MVEQSPNNLIDLVHTLRPRLIRLAYRYLGSVADAEDIVQDAFVKLSQTGDVERPAAWLARVVTNASLDRLRQQKSRRETYIGPWLPEPVIDLDMDASSETELNISFAVMRALERLTPAERASLFLHDLFDLSFEDIASIIHRTPASCRQLASRARKAVRHGGKRFEANPDDLKQFMEALSSASLANDPAIMFNLLSPTADLTSDGGGKAQAALNVLHGHVAVAKFLIGIVRKNLQDHLAVEPVHVNGSAGLLVRDNSNIHSVLTFDRDENGLIKSIYIIRNPDKLSRLKGLDPKPN